MNIRQKMLLGAGLLTLIPVAITAALLTQGASSLAGAALQGKTQAQLVSLRDTKREQITAEINDRVRGLQVLAAQRTTVDGMRALKAGFATAAKDSGVAPAAANQAISEYNLKQFGPEYAKRNAKGVGILYPKLRTLLPQTMSHY